MVVVGGVLEQIRGCGRKEILLVGHEYSIHEWFDELGVDLVVVVASLGIVAPKCWSWLVHLVVHVVIRGWRESQWFLLFRLLFIYVFVALYVDVSWWINRLVKATGVF